MTTTTDSDRVTEIRTGQSRWPVRDTVTGQPEAVCIDVIAPTPEHARTGPGGFLIPTRVVIDGQDVYTPAGASVRVEPFEPGAEAVAVTVTFFARRVRIGYADEITG